MTTPNRRTATATQLGRALATAEIHGGADTRHLWTEDELQALLDRLGDEGKLGRGFTRSAMAREYDRVWGRYLRDGALPDPKWARTSAVELGKQRRTRGEGWGGGVFLQWTPRNVNDLLDERAELEAALQEEQA